MLRRRNRSMKGRNPDRLAKVLNRGRVNEEFRGGEPDLGITWGGGGGRGGGGDW